MADNPLQDRALTSGAEATAAALAESLRGVSADLAQIERTIVETRRALRDDGGSDADPRIPLPLDGTRHVVEQLQRLSEQITQSRRSFLLETIRAARSAGHTTTSVAHGLGISRTRVYQILSDRTA